MAEAVTPAVRRRLKASCWHSALRTLSVVIPSGSPLTRSMSLSGNPAPFNSPSEKPPSAMSCAV